MRSAYCVRIFLSLTLLLTVAHHAQRAAIWAEEPGAGAALKVAWVDLDRVFKEYKGTQKSEGELEGLSKSKQSEREQRVSEIRDLRDELVLLNEESRAKQQQRLEEKFRDLAQFDLETREAIRKGRDEALRGILQDIEAMVQAFAQQRGFDLILTDRAVLYGAKAIDITDEIITLINENAPRS